MGKSTLESLAGGVDAVLSFGPEVKFRKSGKPRRLSLKNIMIGGALAGATLGLVNHIHDTEDANLGEAIGATVDGGSRGLGWGYELGAMVVGGVVWVVDQGFTRIGLEEVGNFVSGVAGSDVMNGVQDGRGDVNRVSIDWGN